MYLYIAVFITITFIKGLLFMRQIVQVQKTKNHASKLKLDAHLTQWAGLKSQLLLTERVLISVSGAVLRESERGFRWWVWMQQAVSSPLQYSCTSAWQHVPPRAFASTTTTTTWPNQRGIQPHPFPPAAASYDRVTWLEGRLCSAVRRSAAVQRAQTALLLTQIPLLPRHIGLTLPPERQDMDRFAPG